MGARLLSTVTRGGVQYHCPYRREPGWSRIHQLVVRLNNLLTFRDISQYRSNRTTNRKFISYDRSVNTGLDYAVNRHYDPQQGRFT